MKDKTSVTSSLSNKDTLTDAQVNAGFDFNTILTSPDLNGQLYDIDSQVNIITKEICNFLTNNGVTLNSGDNSQVYTLLNSLFSAKQNTLVAGANITIDENNVISTTGSSPANIPLFWFGWLDSKPQNVSWVNASNYSWLYASTYVSAYEKLDSQLNPVGTFVEGDSYYVCMFSDGESFTTTVPVNSGTLAQLESWCSSQGYTYSGATIEELECYMTLSASSETIEGITITYYETFDGKKIVVGDAEIANAESIYNVTGVAWYYIMDTVNQRFKLPRTKWGFTGLRDKAGKYVEPNYSHYHAWGYNNNNNAGTFIATNDTGVNVNLPVVNNTSGLRSWNGSGSGGTFSQSSATYKANMITSDGISFDNTNTVQPAATQMYLYFYLGMSGEEETAEIAGIKAETINNKADRNLRNIDTNSGADAVIEYQAPNAGNNYTWYRKYASGWVEQGGVEYFTNSSAVVRTITLPVEMTDTNYNISVCSGRTDSNQDAPRAVGYYNITTTGFGYILYAAGGWTSQSTTSSWEVKGMAAS